MGTVTFNSGDGCAAGPRAAESIANGCRHLPLGDQADKARLACFGGGARHYSVERLVDRAKTVCTTALRRATTEERGVCGCACAASEGAKTSDAALVCAGREDVKEQVRVEVGIVRTFDLCVRFVTGATPSGLLPNEEEK